MNLATLQRQMVGLIQGNYLVSEKDDDYIREVADSEHLKVVQNVIRWWLAFDLERSCVLTSTLLKRYGYLDEALGAFVDQQTPAPFRAQLTTMFLETLCGCDNKLVACVAQFELALIKIKQGDATNYVIDWMYEPYAVLASLLTDSHLDEERARGFYQTNVSRNFPALFQVVSMQP